MAKGIVVQTSTVLRKENKYSRREDDVNDIE